MRAFDQHFASVYNDIERFPSLDHVAAEMGSSKKTVRNRAGEMRATAGAPSLVSRLGTGRSAQPATPANDAGQVEPPQFRHHSLIKPVEFPAYPDRTRYFITAYAQNASAIHDDFVTNLEAYAEWLGDCSIHISGGTYGKSLFEDHSADEAYYHARLEPYLTNDQLAFGDGLIFAGEMNTLPTATMPLSGFETYTRDKWGIFPHTKVQLQAIATAKHARTKQLMTTGAVTMPNYIQKKSGIKASFNHQIGAVLTELLPDGTFFCRHLHADGLGSNEGGFYDLDCRVEAGIVTTGHRVEAITYGDIHHEKIDPIVAATTWGYRGESDTDECLLDYLKPRHQFFHDLSDFSARNHHSIKDHHFVFSTHRNNTDNVELALAGCAEFLEHTFRDWCKSVVVTSNHDNALLTWLKTSDYREDPVNAMFFLKSQLSYYSQLASGTRSPHIFQQVLAGLSSSGLNDIIWVREDDSYLIAGDIECAMHGHLGANGSRGSPRQYARFGKKSNTGHTHSPQIIDGGYVTGVSGSLDMGYNIGASSWDHAHVITYPNGTRAILTMMGSRWFA